MQDSKRDKNVSMLKIVLLNKKQTKKKGKKKGLWAYTLRKPEGKETRVP